MDRRHLLQAGVASLAVAAAVPFSLFDPREARAQGMPFKVLSPDEVTTIEAVNGAFASLSPDAQHAVIEALRTGTIKPWDSSGGVAAPVFYGMMRNDGVDVVYGSVEGFKNLDIPYMPHIMPKATW
jgi:hypothetical protein